MPQPSSSKSRKKFTVKSSVRLCEERLGCKGSNPEAVYQCADCKSLQCDLCRVLIHEQGKNKFHELVKLETIQSVNLCVGCPSKNFANVFCGLCSKRLCYECDAVVHSKLDSRMHRRTDLQQPIAIVGPVPASTASTSSSTPDTMMDMKSVPMDVSVEDFKSCDGEQLLPDVSTMHIADLTKPVAKPRTTLNSPSNIKSFQLISMDETIPCNEDEFIKNLGCTAKTLVKVVSIFGNTGEGKSYTMNHIFFDTNDVFTVSPSQTSCTLGVWAAYDKNQNTIVLDTEGMLGITTNEKLRTRLLMKIMAISDLVIYRTRAERLHNDMFEFLGKASEAYLKYFQKELQNTSQKCNLDMPVSSLGPGVIIFHETTHTDILRKGSEVSPDEEIRRRFSKLNDTIGAYSAIEYVGTKTTQSPTDFSGIKSAINKNLQNSTVRSARPAISVYRMLKFLNEMFSSNITNDNSGKIFLCEYFTCPFRCTSCQKQCTNRSNHLQEQIPHNSQDKCVYQHQFNNHVYYCSKCYDESRQNIVVRKTSSSTDSTLTGLLNYTLYGFVFECPHCGIIYYSRKHWYGNEEPTNNIVRTEPAHVWPDGTSILQGTECATQRVLDTVNTFSTTISEISAGPTKAVAGWVSDKIRPSYWKPDYTVVNCCVCRKEFGPLKKDLHHCRACGDGVCYECSTKKGNVPGWGPHPVRVCDTCYEKAQSCGEQPDLMARKVTETLGGALGILSAAVKYPLQVIKDSARPSYWIPDDEIVACSVCNKTFKEIEGKHHCRGCGRGVCDACSANRIPVPNRGWDSPVRVCEKCYKMKEIL